MSTEQQPPLDSVVTAVINSFKQRAEFGQKKYGTNLDRTDLSVLDWIQHAQEEHMDAILYLEKLKQCFQNKSPFGGDNSPLTQQAPLQSVSLHQESKPVVVAAAPVANAIEAKVKPLDQIDEKYLTHWGCQPVAKPQAKANTKANAKDSYPLQALHN